MPISNQCVTFGENLNFSFDRIDQALAVIGSANASLVMRYGSWSLDESQIIPANVHFSIPPGASLNGAYTLTINGPFSGSKSCFGSTITVVFGTGSVDNLAPKWWGETYTSLTKTRACMTTSGIPADLGSIANDPTTTGWDTDEKGIRWFNMDAGIWKWWDGTQVLELTGGTGATDHGSLTGLTDDDHTQYIKHALATAANDFLAASGSGAYVKKTLAETKTILGLLALAFKNTVGSAEVDDEAITYAKMQHVSATDKLLGRSTAGAGDVEEIACTTAGRALLDDAAASNQRATLKVNSLYIGDYASLAAAITAIGATETTLIIDSAITLTASATIPATLTLKILRGGSLVKASSYTVTFGTPPEAGAYQIFSGFSAGNITFPTGTVLKPQWFGAKLDGSTDDSAALVVAVGCLPASGVLKFNGIGVFGTGSTSQLLIDKPNITFNGFGSGGLKLIANSGWAEQGSNHCWVLVKGTNVTEFTSIGMVYDGNDENQTRISNMVSINNNASVVSGLKSKIISNIFKDCYGTALLAWGTSDLSVIGNQFHRTTGETGAAFCSVTVDRLSFMGNLINGGDDAGCYLTGTNVDHVYDGNTFVDCDNDAFSLYETITGLTIAHNTFRNCGPNPISESGATITNKRYYGNTGMGDWEDWYILASVGATLELRYGNRFYITNAGAQTITSLTGYDGQEVILMFGDANTTLDRASCGGVFAGGVNYVSATYSVLTLAKKGNYWIEVSRANGA